MKTRPYRGRVQHRGSCTCGWSGNWQRSMVDAAIEQNQHDRDCTFIDDARTAAGYSAWPTEGDTRFKE